MLPRMSSEGTTAHPVNSPPRSPDRRLRAWGLALLSVAGVLWIWAAVLLLTPYHVTVVSVVGGGDRKCEAPLFAEVDEAAMAKKGTALVTACAAERRWPTAVAVIGTSVPVSVFGAVLYTTGALGRRLSDSAGPTRAPARQLPDPTPQGDQHH